MISSSYLTAQIESDPKENPNEVQAKFMNGDAHDFRLFIESIVKYPELTNDEELYGRIVVEFMIDSLGNLTNIKILKSLRKDFDEAVIDALEKSPKWTPATINNRPVSQRFTAPFYNKTRIE